MARQYRKRAKSPAIPKDTSWLVRHLMSKAAVSLEQATAFTVAVPLVYSPNSETGAELRMAYHVASLGLVRDDRLPSLGPENQSV
jgi:hypothetical protein